MQGRSANRETGTERIDRRELLRRGAALGAALAVHPWTRAARAQAAPRVVIVGAGLAGLSAAYRLWRDDGIAAEVYEAQDRVGGRVLTHRVFGNAVAEGGGQTINSNEATIRSLVSELGLSLVDLDRVWPTGRIVYQLNGRERRWGAFGGALREAERVAYRHYRSIDWPVTHDSAGAEAARWDRVTAADWIDRYCPGGLRGLAGEYLRVLFEVDYAGPVTGMSAIHVIAELGGTFWGGGYDERYTIRGGNDRLPSALEAALPPGAVRRGQHLVAVSRDGSGRPRCSLSTGAAVADVVADAVILALPFAVLRQLDTANAGFSEVKRAAIERLGAGINRKLHLEFDREPWRPATGETWTDLRIGTTWPEDPGQQNAPPLLVSMTGTRHPRLGSAPAHGPAPRPAVLDALAPLDRIFPGARRAYAERSYLDDWPADPWARGSYSYYLAGDFTSFAGAEGQPEGPFHFAGEHTAPYPKRGTMNGAIESGFRAADEVIASSG
ncbi:MAG: flavin monoamine oxidase family protein [Actinomycetota bacterium]